LGPGYDLEYLDIDYSISKLGRDELLLLFFLMKSIEKNKEALTSKLTIWNI
jgi:hypothetical protein